MRTLAKLKVTIRRSSSVPAAALRPNRLFTTADRQDVMQGRTKYNTII